MDKESRDLADRIEDFAYRFIGSPDLYWLWKLFLVCMYVMLAVAVPMFFLLASSISPIGFIFFGVVTVISFVLTFCIHVLYILAAS